jgi:LysR family glycine cleavage system transcriptional activator
VKTNNHRPPDVSLDDLRAFDAAAQTLSFRAAAARVHRSPAAFSDGIARLEAQLECRLFERTTRKVTLTAAGARLWLVARRVLDTVDDLGQAAREASSAVELTLGTRFELGLSWLTPALDPLRRARPERTLHLHVGDGPSLLASVKSGAIDAMVTSLRLDQADVVSVPLHPEEYRFVAAPALICSSPLDRPSDAARHTLCDTAPGMPLFRYLLDRVGGSPWPFQRHEWLGGVGAVRHRVVAGAGVGVLPHYLVAPDLDAGRLVELMCDQRPLSDVFRLSWRLGHPHARELTSLAEELRAFPLR